MSGQLHHVGPTNRLGIMIPSANAVMEMDAATLRVPGVSVHTARLPLTRDTRDEILALRGYIPAAAKSLADASVGAIAFACTSGSLLGGRDYDREIAEEISDLTGIPATTTTGAITEALKRLELSHLALVCPYPSWLVASLIDFFAQRGIQIEGHFSWETELPRQIESVRASEIVDEGTKLVRRLRSEGRPVEGVLIACTGFQGMASCSELESRLGIPAVSSNLATFWHLFDLLGIDSRPEGLGTLMELR